MSSVPHHSARLAAMVIALLLCWSALPAAGRQGSDVPTPATEQRALGAPAAPQHPVAGSSGAASDTSWVTQTVLALAGVLAIAILGGTLVRAAAKAQGGLRASLGAGGRAPAGILEVIGRYPIARGSSLILLKVDRRILLLSQSTQGRLGAGAAFSTLCEIDDPEEVASLLVKARDVEGDSMAERFRGLLSRFDRSMEPVADASPMRKRSSSGVDRVELWDEARGDIPVIDLTREPGPRGEGGPIASLRKRLASLRPDGGRTQ
jgi:hypothetical protein